MYKQKARKGVESHISPGDAISDQKPKIPRDILNPILKGQGYNQLGSKFSAKPHKDKL